MAIDAALGRLGIKPGVCTSSTRPANPFEGQVIYETDTNRTLVYDNSAWLVVADNQVLSIDTTNSRVGIGTTSPGATLTVTSSSAGTDNSVILQNFTGDASAISSARSLVLSADYDNNSGGSQSYIALETDASERMRISSSGNVGINDATPSYTLDVNGDINASGDLRIGGTAIGDYIDYSGSVTFNNFTLGNGSVSSYYTRVNDLVHFVGAVTLGSTSSVTGSWSVNLPVNNAFQMVGHGFVHFNDTGTDIYLGTLSTGAGSASFKWFGVTGGKVSDSGVNATLPFTWTTNDFLRWDLLYRAA